MFWWLVCAGSVGAMLGFSLAAWLAAGKRADLETSLAETQELCTRAFANEEAWRAKHEAMTYAFSTLCGAIKKLGLGTEEEP